MLLCHLLAVAAPLSRGDSPKHGDSERIREQAPRRGYSAIQYFNSLLGDRVLESGRQASVREITETVGNVFTGCRVSFGPPSDNNRSYRVSFEKIRKPLPGLRCLGRATGGGTTSRPFRAD